MKEGPFCGSLYGSPSPSEVIPPELLWKYAQGIKFVNGPEEGYRFRLEIARQARAVAGEEGEEELPQRPGPLVLGREGGSPGTASSKDEIIAQLRAELKAEREKNRALATAVGTMEAMMPEPQKIEPQEQEEKEASSWLKRVGGWLRGGTKSPNQIARERAAKIRAKDRAHPIVRSEGETKKVGVAAEVITAGREDDEEVRRLREMANKGIAQRNRELDFENRKLREDLELARKKIEELSRPAKRRSALKIIAHGIGTALVLGHFLLGSGGLPSGRRGVESEEVVFHSDVNQLREMKKMIRELKSRAQKPVLVSEEASAPVEPVETAEVPEVVQEEEASSLALKVTITESCFWASARQPVANWLKSKGLVGWTNGEITLGDVLIKKIVEAARKQGFDLSLVERGDEFEFRLEENEELMAVAQTQSFEEYRKMLASVTQ